MDGMACAKMKGIAHRDLKPGNTMIIDGGDASPRVKVIDFGLAKLLENASDQILTRPGEVFRRNYKWKRRRFDTIRQTARAQG